MQSGRSYSLDELNDLADLPIIINDLFPGANAKLNRGGLCFAVWRGNKNTPAVDLNKKGGRWLYYDHGNAGVPDDKRGGNSYQFLTTIAGYTDAEAYEYLLEHLNLSDGNYRPLDKSLLSEARASYKTSKEVHKGVPHELSRRGISAETMARAGIWEDETGIIIPVLDQFGNPYDFKKRFTNGDKKRYMFLYGKERKHIAHHLKTTDGKTFSEALESEKSIFFIEGELNAIAAQQALGDDFLFIALTGQACHIYGELVEDRNVFIYTDKDSTSERLADYLAEYNPESISILPLLDEGKTDYCDINAKGMLHDTVYTQIAESKRVFDVYYKKVGLWTIEEHLEAIDKRLSGKIIYPTSFVEIDNRTNGLEATGITVIAALSGYGKSILLRQFIDSILTFTNEKVRIYTPDQNSVNLMYLMALYRAKLNSDLLSKNLPLVGDYKLRFKDLPELREYFKRVHLNTLTEYSKRMQVVETLSGTEAKVNLMLEDMMRAADKGVKVFAIDFIQFYSLYGNSESDTMVALKDFARSTKSQILIAAQLAKVKFGHDRPPDLGGIPISTDIEGRGATYQLADQVFAIYNQDKYMREFGFDSDNYRPFETTDIGNARIYVLKHKMAEAGYFIYTKWHGEKSMFSCMLGGRDGAHTNYLRI